MFHATGSFYCNFEAIEDRKKCKTDNVSVQINSNIQRS